MAPIRDGSGVIVSRQPAKGAVTRKAQKKPGLSFITITDLSQAKSKACEKAIRSHVAHVQHYREWKEQQKEEDVVVTKRQSARSVLTETGVEDINRTDSWDGVGSGSKACLCDTLEGADGSCKGSCNADTAWKWMEWNYAGIMMNGFILSGKLAPGIRVDPFASAPMQGEHVPRITDHCKWPKPLPSTLHPQKLTRTDLQHMAISVPEIDLGVTHALRDVWFPFAMTEPSVFQTVMLLSASNYFFITQDHSKVPNLLLLRQKALLYINEGLKDPARAHSDQLIVAVAKMACYEAMYGTYTLYETHMRGLVRMLEERGGIESLGLGGLLMRMCLWIDVNCGLIHNNSKRFFSQSATFAHRSAIRPR
jgi:hypothetical protein